MEISQSSDKMQETPSRNIPIETPAAFTNSVVIDNGTGLIKCGMSYFQNPQVVPSVIGRPRLPKIIVNAPSNEIHVGQEAQRRRGILSLTYPIEHGIVTNWDDMTAVWQSVYYDVLKISPEDYPVTVTEAPRNPKSHRKHLAEVFFEFFNAPALYIGIQAVLSLYATGRVNGLVLDSGDGVTHVAPVYEGYILPHAIMRMNIAGRDLTKHMTRLLNDTGISFSSSADFEIVREIKESVCYVCDDVVKESEKLNDPSKALESSVKHVLPDGTQISIDSARYLCPEALFDPRTVGVDTDGIHQVVHNSISQCDIDVRRTLYGSIVLSGGNTMFPGIQDRLKKELIKLTNSKNVSPSIEALPERKYLVWLGASVLAQLPQFSTQLCVTRSEFFEKGSSIALSKFF